MWCGVHLVSVSHPQDGCTRFIGAGLLFLFVRLAHADVDELNQFLGVMLHKDVSRDVGLKEQRGQFRQQGVGQRLDTQPVRFLELSKAVGEVGHPDRGSYGQVGEARP